MAGELIFVTGGTGFLGRHLVDFLLKEGYRVRMLVRSTSDISWLPEGQVDIVTGDITDFQALNQGVGGCKYVIHAAGHFRFWGAKQQFESTNILGTENICKAVLENRVERLVYISTVAVVGQPRHGEIIDEETICHPKDDYQKSKYAAERMIIGMANSHDLPGVILRPGAFYGPGSRYGFNRLFIEEPMRGWRVQIDNGRHFTFPVFILDVPPAILKALKIGTPGEIYNISDQSITHTELNKIISPLLEISTWRLNVPSFIMIALAGFMELISKITRREPYYSLNLRHYVFGDWRVLSEKARRELDFVPTPIDEGLRKTVAWYKEDGWKK